ncbi:Protein CBG14245 [Caenorhabditis briggsae]|uniref:Protein CBG14245 n=1 Tax=Caenorhabditis briggsae TaxID=6238 RepID=A8XJL3_CAEBR|nr:Protein CBG14245 [Caenorhabditis briggsae]CAP32839.2 Protein CBG14245 [Caenorhabditis briggsae]
MTHLVPRILGFVLFVLGAAILLTEVMHSYTRYIRQSETYTVTSGDSQDPPKKQKQLKTFFSLYRNMDEIIEQNTDTIQPRVLNGSAHEFCNNTDHCIRPFMRHETRYRVAPDYKMAHCIMCYLYNRNYYLKVDKQMNMSEWDKAALCRGDNTFRHLKSLQKKYNVSQTGGWSYSMITRDPIDRFVSGYVDRCIRVAEGSSPCNGCDKNMTCFILSEYERFKKQAIKGVLTNTFEDRHFYPQNWRCDIRSMRHKYEFIRYSSDPSQQLMEDLFKIARRQGVPENELEFIEDELTKNRKTTHTTAYSPAREFYQKRLRENPLLMEYVVRMFYHDFVILNYPFPEGF